MTGFPRTATWTTLTCLALLAAGHAAGADWLQWGGPAGDYTVPSAPLAENWPPGGPKRLWERTLGPGYSSILAKGDTLVTMYRAGNDEVVVALGAATGTTRWAHRDQPVLWEEMTREFGVGPNATPLIIGDRVVAIGISGRMRCLDLESGRLLWQRDLPADFGRRKRVEEYGYSGSPIAFDGAVIALVGGDQAAVVAFDPKNGSTRWKSRPGGVSYAPPSIVRLAGEDQYVYFEPEGVAALDPRTGALLWTAPIEFNNGNHLTPVVQCDEHHLWVGSQFQTGGGRLLEITRQAERWSARQLWFAAAMQTSHWPLIRVGEFIYGSIGGNSRSQLTAFRWKTGEVVWKRPGYHKAQALWADGKLLFLDESGQLVLGKATPGGFEPLAQARITEPISWSLPTLVGSTLYVRDQARIMALDLGSQPPGK